MINLFNKDLKTQENINEDCKQGIFSKVKSKWIKCFNILYILTTAFVFFYYVYYVYYKIHKNGINNVISILLLIFIILYAIVLISSIIVSSSIKTAKKRINKNLVYVNFFRKFVKILSLILSTTILVFVIKSDDTDFFTLIISIINLIFTTLRIIIKTRKLTLGINKKIHKEKKAKIKYLKKEKQKEQLKID